MIKIILWAALLILLITSGCKKDTPIEPQPSKPPGYQEDIPWPSLADSPWPMYRADPQNTGRSKYFNFIQGKVAETKDVFFTELSFAIGPDASFYFVSIGPVSLVCVDSAGNTKWKSGLPGFVEGIYQSPLILNDGSIITADVDAIYKFSSSGREIWRYTYPFHQMPKINIDKEGNIYFLDENNSLLALSGSGQLLWKISRPGEYWYGITPISPDGKTIYVTGRYLYAIDLVERKIKWTTDYATGIPSVDSNGRIYAFKSPVNDSSEIVCLNENGEPEWLYRFKDEHTLLTEILSIDKKGNIYFGDDNVYSLNYQGKLNWKLERMNSPQPIACDNRNNIYLAREVPAGLTIRCFSEDGSMVWQETIETTEIATTMSGLALGYDRLLIANNKRFSPVYIIK